MDSIKASIDIGTNSVLLLVISSKEEGNNFEILAEDARITRIGEGVSDSSFLKYDAMKRTINVLQEYKKIATELGASVVKVVATSAVRDAKNSSEFIALAKQSVNIDVEIISGDREAELVYESAITSAKSFHINRMLVVDIGGGSTEFIVGKESKIEKVRSLQCGSVRMTEECLRDDPPTPFEMKLLRKIVQRKLSEIIPSEWEAECCIGVAGTVTTVAQIMLGIMHYKRSLIEGYKIEIQRLEELIDKLSMLKIEERKKITGLHPDRADVILAGAVILQEIMNHFNYSFVITSTMGLRYGLLMN
ncbi:MAG: Ppx/GppA family phosphatase [Candidatus Schekmanbacteria bacterium]|nr:Ppx/GppA family phosphatase [Candidatus Schekmanbacteria bacterium]